MPLIDLSLLEDVIVFEFDFNNEALNPLIYTIQMFLDSNNLYLNLKNTKKNSKRVIVNLYYFYQIRDLYFIKIYIFIKYKLLLDLII